MGASRTNQIESFSQRTPGDMFIDPGVSIEGTGNLVARSADIINNGTISVSGLIDFRSGAGIRNRLLNNGTVNVAGTTSVGTLEVRDGDFTQSSTGILNVKIGTTTADQLLVPVDPYHPSGGANLAGRLNARLLGLAPPPGSRFTVISCGARTGTFSSTSLPPAFTVQYSPTSVVLAR
jgi:hypothetical protein